MAERICRWTINPLGSPRAGSNPADYVDYCIWRVARDCRLSQGAPLSQVRSRFQISLFTGVSLPVARAPPSFEKELVKSSPRRLQESVKDVCCIPVALKGLCPVRGSNSRPSDYETDALPTALTRLCLQPEGHPSIWRRARGVAFSSSTLWTEG